MLRLEKSEPCERLTRNINSGLGLVATRIDAGLQSDLKHVPETSALAVMRLRELRPVAWANPKVPTQVLLHVNIAYLI